MTNAHVVDKCREITVTSQGGAPATASLVKSDTANNLAVLIAAPVQPGNRGSPLLDTSGHVVGIITLSLGGK